jgi:hypothetical protein
MSYALREMAIQLQQQNIYFSDQLTPLFQQEQLLLL